MLEGIGLISKCLLGILTCTYYPVNAEPPVDHVVVMVCPEGMQQSPSSYWTYPLTRLELTNRFGQRMVLQLQCPLEGGES